MENMCLVQNRALFSPVEGVLIVLLSVSVQRRMNGSGLNFEPKVAKKNKTIRERHAEFEHRLLRREEENMVSITPVSISGKGSDITARIHSCVFYCERIATTASSRLVHCSVTTQP